MTGYLSEITLLNWASRSNPHKIVKMSNSINSFGYYWHFALTLEIAVNISYTFSTLVEAHPNCAFCVAPRIWAHRRKIFRDRLAGESNTKLIQGQKKKKKGTNWLPIKITQHYSTVRIGSRAYKSVILWYFIRFYGGYRFSEKYLVLYPFYVWHSSIKRMSYLTDLVMYVSRQFCDALDCTWVF